MRVINLLADGMPAIALVGSVGVLCFSAWHIDRALGAANRVHALQESVVAALVAEEAAFEIARRMPMQLADSPQRITRIHNPVGMTTEVEILRAKDRPVLQLKVRGKSGQHYTFGCELQPGSAPRALGYPLSIRPAVVAERPELQAWIQAATAGGHPSPPPPSPSASPSSVPPRRLDVYSPAARALPTEAPVPFDPAVLAMLGTDWKGVREDGAIALLRLPRGTDGRDFVLRGERRGHWRPPPPMLGVARIPGNLWIDRSESPLVVELQGTLTILVEGNVYIGRSLIVRGEGRLMIVARRGGRGVIRDIDASGGLTPMDEVLHHGVPEVANPGTGLRPVPSGGAAASAEGASGRRSVSYRGVIEGSGGVYLGLPGDSPIAPVIAIGAGLVVEGELHLRARSVTIHGPLVLGEGMTWTAAGELRLAGDQLPNVDREPLPGFLRDGAYRPGLLEPRR